MDTEGGFCEEYFLGESCAMILSAKGREGRASVGHPENGTHGRRHGGLMSDSSTGNLKIRRDRLVCFFGNGERCCSQGWSVLSSAWKQSGHECFCRLGVGHKGENLPVAPLSPA